MPSDLSSADPSVTADPMGGDGRQLAARRVDWRFLLDRPEPDEVLVAGRPDAALMAGLGSVAGSVRSLDSPAAGDGELVVIAGALDDAGFAAAAAAVRPGGWIVVETEGLMGRLRRPLTRVRGRHATRMMRALRANGFEAVRAHVALPHREAPTALVSLEGAGGLGWWLARLRGGPKATLARRAGRAAPVIMRGGIVASLVPGTVVTGRRPLGAGRSEPAGWLRQRLAALDPATLAGRDPASAEIVLLTPRFEASAHVIALIVERTGSAWEPRVVIKVARGPDGRQTLAREGEALGRLAHSLGSTGHAPCVLDLDIDASPPSLVETGIRGEPLDPRAVRRDRQTASSAIVDFVARLPVGSATADADAAPSAPSLAEIALARLDLAGVDPGLVERSRPLVERLRAARLPTVFEHGDLAHPNLIIRSDGTLAAVDWERAEPHGLPLHDLTMGVGYIAAAAASASAGWPDRQAQAFIAALTGNDAWAARILDTELDRLGIDRDLRPVLTMVPWIRTAAFLADRTSTDWLRTDRSVALWRASLHLAERDEGRCR